MLKIGRPTLLWWCVVRLWNANTVAVIKSEWLQYYQRWATGQSAFYVCFSEDLRREKFVSLAWRRELDSRYDNWRNTGARCCCFGVSLFLD